MRIYAAEEFDIETPFDEYVGKNAWVRCHLDGGESYVRFLHKDVRGSRWVVFTIDYVNTHTLDEYHRYPDLFHVRSAKSLVNRDGYNKDYIKLVTPVDVLSTEELFGLEEYSFGNPIIKNVLGKPYWLRVNTEDYGEAYVKFIEQNEDTVLCDIVDTKYIENYEYDSWDSYPEDWMQEYEWVHLDSLDIVEPVDMLTDAELMSAFNAAQDEWEENFLAEQDEEEEEEDDI